MDEEKNILQRIEDAIRHHTDRMASPLYAVHITKATRDTLVNIKHPDMTDEQKAEVGIVYLFSYPVVVHETAEREFWLES